MLFYVDKDKKFIGYKESNNYILSCLYFDKKEELNNLINELEEAKLHACQALNKLEKEN